MQKCPHNDWVGQNMPICMCTHMCTKAVTSYSYLFMHLSWSVHDSPGILCTYFISNLYGFKQTKTEAVWFHANTLCWHPGVPATISFDKYWQIIRPFSVFLHQLNLYHGTNLLGKTCVRSTEGKSFIYIQYVFFFMQEMEEKECSWLALDFIIKSTTVILPLVGL